MLHKRLNRFIRNPKKALFTLALPTVIAMVVQTMYNVVDTAFVGRLGVEAIAALTFAFPVFFIIIALNQGLNVGMSAKISQFIGAKNKTAAENVAVHGLLISLAVGLFLSVLSLVFLKTIFVFLGASGEVLGLSISYMQIILLGSVVAFPAFMFHGIFTSQGDTKTSMKIQVSSLILNIVLDPIFIFVFGLGVRGAAIATALAWLFSLLLSVYYLKKKSHLDINLKVFDFSPWIVKKIIFIGAPASLLMLLISAYVLVLNKVMVYFSNAHVAAVGIAFRLENVAIMPVVGGSIALLTLVGMFYGARRYDLVKKTIFYGLKVGILFTLAGSLIIFIFAELFLRIFTTDASLIALGANFVRIDVWVLPVLAVATLINRSMQGLGTGLPGLVINIVRVLAVSIPLTLIFVFVLGFGYLSAAWADVIGGSVAAVVAVTWIVLKLKKLHLLNSDSL